MMLVMMIAVKKMIKEKDDVTVMISRLIMQ